MFTFKGRAVNDEEVLEIMNRAPAVYIRYMRAYLNYAGRVFIGTKKKDGVLRKLLGSLKASRGGTWQRKFVNAAANFRLDKNILEMRAGIIYTNKKKIHEIMEQLESGATKNSDKYMIIPNRKEISALKHMGLFKGMINSKQLRTIYKRGNVYFIDKKTNRLLFTGTKRVVVPKKWDFESTYETVRPNIDKRGMLVLDKATAAIDKKEASGIQIELGD